MHPIERLRYVARADGTPAGVLAAELALSLAELADDRAALVMGARRVVDRHPDLAQIWWVAARVLGADDVVGEALAVAGSIEEDSTAALLAAALPEAATVVSLGWPVVLEEALWSRRDLDVVVLGDAGALGRRLRRCRAGGLLVDDLPLSAVAEALEGAAVLVVEALGVGPHQVRCGGGSAAVLARARASGVPAWLLASTGVALPGRLWGAFLARAAGQSARGPGWEGPSERSRSRGGPSPEGLGRTGREPAGPGAPDDVVELSELAAVVGPEGRRPAGEAASIMVCPEAPELLRPPTPTFGR